MITKRFSKNWGKMCHNQIVRETAIKQVLYRTTILKNFEKLP